MALSPGSSRSDQHREEGEGTTGKGIEEDRIEEKEDRVGIDLRRRSTSGCVVGHRFVLRLGRDGIRQCRRILVPVV